jgi:hypothetical protein
MCFIARFFYSKIISYEKIAVIYLADFNTTQRAKQKIKQKLTIKIPYPDIFRYLRSDKKLDVWLFFLKCCYL